MSEALRPKPSAHGCRCWFVTTVVVVSVAFVVMIIFAVKIALLTSSPTVAAPSVIEAKNHAGENPLSHDLKRLDVAGLRASIGELTSVLNVFKT